ncbi:MAG: hypothetical protein M1124_00590 [Candidatus Marsarchaeota archaeon]|jgi:hypothetical protein|nr:hypothetical protein [Candidatus Marsarchaeota archaeon]
MKKYLIIALFLSAFFSISFAAGIGTSKISFSNTQFNITQGSSVSVNYTVALVSGSKWGTSISLLNQTALLQKGINIVMSNPSGDPTFSGVLTIISAPTTPPGQYILSFQATGDDPSVNNSTIILNVASSTHATSASITSQSQIPNSSVSSSSVTPPVYAANYSVINYILYALILITLIVNIYFVAIMKYFNAKLIFVSTALILLGSLVWLYGDFNGGFYSYVSAGFAAIIIGTLLWLYADYKGGAFKK